MAAVISVLSVGTMANAATTAGLHAGHVLGQDMLLPWDDWQFWIVTAVFVFAVAWLLRGMLPIPILSRKHRRKRRGEKKATLTISGRPVGK